MTSLQAVLAECRLHDYARSLSDIDVRESDIRRAVEAIAEVTRRTLESSKIAYVDDFNVDTFVR